MRNIRKLYGSHPIHFLLLLACFALAGYTVAVLGPGALWNRTVWWHSIVVWFVAAILVHDIVAFPLYALADRVLGGLMRSSSLSRTAVPPLNYLRLPALAAHLLLVLFLPGIIEQGTATYHAATGQTQSPYLARWLLITAALFVISALAYALRRYVAAAGDPTAARRLLDPGDRLLGTALGKDCGLAAVASRWGLRYRGDELDSPWHLLGWEDLHAVTWQPDTGELVVTGLPGATPNPVRVPLVDAAKLAEVSAVLMRSAVITTCRIDIHAGHDAIVTVRRAARDRFAWSVHLPDGLDPGDPAIQTTIDAALATLSSELGKPAPRW
ncbi:MAG: hypothetical protein ACRDRL_03415 [Sciscionella sp.]